MFLRQSPHALASFHAFHHAIGRGQRVRQGHSASNFFTERSVAALGTETRGGQIANTRYAKKSFLLGAHDQTQSHNFSHSARKQRAFGVEAHFQSIQYSRGQRHNIFCRAGNFNANRIAAGVDAQPWPGKNLLHQCGEGLVITCAQQRGGKLPRQFTGDGWTTQHGKRARACHGSKHIKRRAQR